MSTASLAVGGDAHPLRHHASAYGRDVAEADLRRAVGRYHDIAQFVEPRNGGVGDHEVELVVILDAAVRHQHIARADRLRHIEQGELVRGEAGGIDRDFELVLIAARHVDARHAFHRRQQRPHLELREIVQRGERLPLRRQAIRQHRKHGGVHAPHLHRGALRQRREYFADGRLRLQGGLRHVGAPVEIDRDFGAPRLVFDSTSRTFGTRRSASSTGIVTSVAICSAGRSPASSETTARGNATFGNSEIGRRNAVSAPAIASNAITNSSERRCFCIH